MNADCQRLCEKLIPSAYVQQGVQARRTRENLIRHLLEQVSGDGAAAIRGRSYSGADGGEQARGRVNRWPIRAPTSAPELRTFGAFYRKMRHFLQNLTCQAFRYICYKFWFFVS